MRCIAWAVLLGAACVSIYAAPETIRDPTNRARDTLLQELTRSAVTARSAPLDEIAVELAGINRGIAGIINDQERDRLRTISAILDDVVAVRAYRNDNPVGSFFDDQSSSGLFSRLVLRYASYRPYIERFAVRANGGRILYPTSETVRFLTDLTLERIAEERSRSGGEREGVASQPQTPPIVAPTAPQAPRQPATESAAQTAPQEILQPTPQPVPKQLPGVPPTATAVPSRPLPAPPRTRMIDGCAVTAEIQRIDESERGVVVSADAPISGRIAAITSVVADDAFGGAGLVTIEIPAATISGVSPTAAFRQGPFASVRITRFRTDGQCGVRLRLQPRKREEWEIAELPNALLIGRKAPVTTPGLAADESPRPGGGIMAVGTASASRAESGVASATQVEFGASQRLRNGNVIRAFFAPIVSTDRHDRFFGAVGISGFQIRGLDASAAAGDLSVNFGSAFFNSASFFNGLIIRGAGASIRGERSQLEVFGGRAAASTLLRLPGTAGVISDITDDRVFGAQWSWAVQPKMATGFGWARSLPVGGGTQNNFFQALEYAEGESVKGRLVLEESRRAGAQSGWALTLDPQITAGRTSLSGFFRYTSRDFRPAVASSLFASLRRSYGLAATFRPADRISLFASASKIKTFSLFDAEDVGSISGNATAGAFWQLNDHHGLSVTHSDSNTKSDPGSVLPTDSRTRSNFLAFSSHWTGFSSSLALGRDVTENLLESTAQLRSDQAELSLEKGLHGASQLYSRIRGARSTNERGERVGPNEAFALGYRTFALNRGGVQAEVGYSEQPPGISIFSVRQAYATVSLQPPRSFSLFNGSLSFSYYLLQADGGQKRHAWSIGISGSRLVDWGAGPPSSVPVASRALPITDTTMRLDERMHVTVNVYADENGNSIRDKGEPSLAGVPVAIGSKTLRTRRDGRAEARVDRREQMLRIGPLLDYYFPDATRRITPAKQIEIAVPARPAGRIAVRVVFKGDSPQSTFFNGIRISVSGDGITNETVTDSDGAVLLGPLPEGSYVVRVDRTTLAPETTLVGSDAATVDVRRGVKSEATFEMRRATVRERFRGANRVGL